MSWPGERPMGLRNLLGLLVLAGIAGWVYLHGSDQPRSGMAWGDSDVGPQCRIPYYVRLGSIDPGSDFTPATLEAALRDAFAVWEAHAPKPLFMLLEQDSATPVHLRHDERQELSAAIAREQTAMMRDRTEIDRMGQQLERDTQAFETRSDSFQRERQQFNQALEQHGERVAAYNRSHSESPAERQRLTAERERLDRERQALERLLGELEAERGRIENLRETYNRRVARFNERSTAAAEQTARLGSMTAGRYTRAGDDSMVEVFVAMTYHDLMRILAHELGHALGIEHVPGSDAVMSAVNVTPVLDRVGPVRLSAEDVAALEAVCAEEF